MSKFHGAKAGYEVGKQFLKKVFGKKSKVSPTIKSVKPNLKKTVKETKKELDLKNFLKLEKFRKQKSEGIKSARIAQRELQRSAETKRATKIGKQYFGRSVPPRASDLDNPTVVKTKKFKTGKQIEAEKRQKQMGGGMAGRRMGYSQGSNGSKKSSLGMQSVIHGLDKNPDVTKADPKAKFIARAKKVGNGKPKKKIKKQVI